jgi:hypothetical protein
MKHTRKANVASPFLPRCARISSCSMSAVRTSTDRHRSPISVAIWSLFVAAVLRSVSGRYGFACDACSLVGLLSCPMCPCLRAGERRHCYAGEAMNHTSLLPMAFMAPVSEPKCVDPGQAKRWVRQLVRTISSENYHITAAILGATKNRAHPPSPKAPRTSGYPVGLARRSESSRR